MKKSLIVTASLVVAVGCAATETREVAMPEAEGTYAGVVVNAGNDADGMPDEARDRFEAELSAQLHDAGAFDETGDLELIYSVSRRDPGKRWLRWLVGGMGEGSSGYLVIDVDYRDTDGTALGSIEVEGQVNGGVFGGSVDDAVEPVAQDIADHTIERFAEDL